MGMEHKTAWTWLHKCRRAMVRPDREPHSGTVVIDETFVGGVEHGVSGQQTFTKAIVVVAVERPGPGRYGRISLARVPDKTAVTLHPFVLANVKPGSTVITDAHKGYLGLDRKATRSPGAHQGSRLHRQRVVARCPSGRVASGPGVAGHA